MLSKGKALILEDNQALLHLYRLHFKDTGLYADTLKKAYEYVETETPKIAIIDLCLGGDTSINFIDDLKKKFPNIPIYIVSGFPIQPALAMLGVSKDNFILKPVSMHELQNRIKEDSIN